MSKTPMVVIIDDDDSVREATKSLLRSIDYRVRTFASAEDFLKSDGAKDVACLITDVQMPGISGLELQSRLIKEGHRIPMIFITAFPDGDVRMRALKAGAIGFLEKPFADDSLILCLDNIFARRDANGLGK
jgi:FixJ family two-component response regulator